MIVTYLPVLSLKVLKRTVHILVMGSYFVQTTGLMATDLLESVSGQHPRSRVMDHIVFEDREFFSRNGEHYVFCDALLRSPLKSSKIQWIMTNPERRLLAEIDYIYEDARKEASFSSKTDKPVYMVFRDPGMKLNLNTLDLFGLNLHLCCPLETKTLSFQGKDLHIRNTCTAQEFMCQGSGLLNLAHQGEKLFGIANIRMDSFFNKTPLNVGRFQADCPGEFDFQDKKASIGYLLVNAGEFFLKNDLNLSGDASIKAKRMLSTQNSTLSSEKTLFLNGDDMELNGNVTVGNLDVTGKDFRSNGTLFVRRISSIHPENIKLAGSYSALITSMVGDYVQFDNDTRIMNGHHFSVYGKTNINSYAGKIRPASDISEFSSLSLEEKKALPAGIAINGDGYGLLKGTIADSSEIFVSIQKTLEIQLAPEAGNLFIKTTEGSIKGSLSLNMLPDGRGQNAELSSGKDLHLSLGGKGGNIFWKANRDAYVGFNDLHGFMMKGQAAKNHEVSGKATAEKIVFQGENLHVAKDSDLSAQTALVQAKTSFGNDGTVETEKQLQVESSRIENKKVLKSRDAMFLNGNTVINKGDMSGKTLVSGSETFKNEGNISTAAALIQARKNFVNDGTAKAEHLLLNTGEIRNNNEISGTKILTNDRETFAEVCKNSNLPLANKDLVDTRYIENNKKISGGNTKLVSTGSIHNHDTIEAREILDIKVDKVYLNSIGAKTSGKNIMLDAGTITNILGLMKAEENLVRKSYVDLNLLGLGMAKNIQRKTLFDINLGINLAKDIHAESLVSLRLLPDIGVNVSNRSLVSLGGVSTLALNNSDTALFQAGLFSLGAFGNSTTALLSYNFCHAGFFSNITTMKGIANHVFSGKTSLTAWDFNLGNNFSLMPKVVQQIGLKEAVKKGAGMAGSIVMNELVMPYVGPVVSEKIDKLEKEIIPEKLKPALDYAKKGIRFIQNAHDIIMPLASALPQGLDFLNDHAPDSVKNQFDFARSYLERFPYRPEIKGVLDFVSRHEDFVFHPVSGLLSMGTNMFVDCVVGSAFENISALGDFEKSFLLSGSYRETGMHYGGGDVNFSKILIDSRQMDDSTRHYNGLSITLTENARSAEGVSNLNAAHIDITRHDMGYKDILENKAGFNMNATEAVDVRTNQDIHVDENISNNHAVFLHGKSVHVDAEQNADSSRGFFAENGDLVYNAAVNLNPGTNAVLYHGASGKIENDGYFVRAPYQNFEVKGDANVRNGGLFKADIFMDGSIDGTVNISPDIKLTLDGYWRWDYRKFNNLEPQKKNYETGGFEGGTGVAYTDEFGNERMAGLNMKMGELNSHASAISAGGDTIITAKKINATSDHNDFTYHYWEKKIAKDDTDYNLQRPEFSSETGKVILNTTEGDLRLQGADVKSKDGVGLHAAGGKVILENIITHRGVEHVKKGRPLHAAEHSVREESHGTTIKTEKGIYDAAQYLETLEQPEPPGDPETRVMIPEDNPSASGDIQSKIQTIFKVDQMMKDGIPHVWMTGTEGVEGVDPDISTSLLITDGKYVDFKNAILDQHIRVSSKKKTPAAYNIPLDNSGVSVLLQKLDVLKLKDLSEKQNFEEAAATLNKLATLLECKSIDELVGMVLTPSIGINMSKKLIDHHYQTTGKGCVDTDFWILKGKDYCRLELPALVHQDLFVDTPVFTQQGNILRESLFIKDIGKHFSIGLKGINFSWNKSTTTEHSSNVKNQTLMVFGTIHLNDVQEWNMIGANTYCKDVKGDLPVMHEISLQNEKQGSRNSKSFALWGDFSSSKTKYHIIETVDSGIIIRNDPKNFCLGLFHGVGGYFMIGTPSEFAPGEVIAESSIDSFLMSSKTVGVNLIELAKMVILPETAFVNGSSMINRPLHYSDTKIHQKFEHLVSLINMGTPGKVTGDINTSPLNSARREIVSEKSKANLQLITISTDKFGEFCEKIREFPENLARGFGQKTPSVPVPSFLENNASNPGASSDSSVPTPEVTQGSMEEEKPIGYPIIPVKVNDIPPLQVIQNSPGDKNPVTIAEEKKPLKNMPAYSFEDDDVEDMDEYHRVMQERGHPSICETMNDAGRDGSLLKPILNISEEFLPVVSTLTTACDPESSPYDVAREILLDFMDGKKVNQILKNSYFQQQPGIMMDDGMEENGLPKTFHGIPQNSNPEDKNKK